MDGKQLKKHLTALRFKNFDELLARYGNSPTEFCQRTGYTSPTTISQLKTRKKHFGADLARELELVAQLERYALESETGLAGRNQPPVAGQLKNWPFTISLEDVLALNGKARRQIDEALSTLILGLQTQDLISKQQRKRAG